ncbi:hypothetical protein E1B28_008958 [Marasmius oreades]|uniref:Phosphatidylinositide phosphatase SAC2 n=1 Tax=Marasmius oreades TaxID=181124 RepID=A0A9P7USW5_9AGAR|nr:uncharacterized protein E1B28_008958 [Marasmius oreades]KAG7092615.1 hypothetical protein E1B28_008958 [Marasmius oreades]
MKRLFSRSNKTKPPPAPVHPTAPTNPTAPHTIGLQPKYIVPPIPHPHPYEHLALLAASDGLLIRPHIPNSHTSKAGVVPHVRIVWGKSVKIEELSGDEESSGADWDDAIIVYGIVGILELFTASYLLVITSREEIGNLFDVAHTVYGVRGVSAIPLVESEARTSLHTIASRNAAASRPSLLSSNTMDTVTVKSGVDNSTENLATSVAASPRVRFSTPETTEKDRTNDVLNLNTDEHTISSRTSSDSSPGVSGASTPTSDITPSTSQVAKTVASRLSFWSRLSKRNSLFPASEIESTAPKTEPKVEVGEAVSALKADQMIHEEPRQVLEDILSTTAPPPESTEEKHTEIETKVVREVIREFVKGGMYFAYHFDITRSLQHKQEMVNKARKHDALLADLNALPRFVGDTKIENNDDKVDPLVEPNLTLPLWRRVDKHFWWNESLSKPLIDSGLHSYILPIMQGYYQVARFVMPPEEVSHDNELAVDYVLVSRRSRDRAGLRYQRRGVDDDAHAANFVESETIMRVKREGITNVFSYMQIRGSIPVFWTQAGYGLKPPPVISTERTRQQHLDAMRRHFQRSIPRYGPHTIVNLAEHHGKEGAITQAYRDHMKALDDKNAQYYEYDFHTETRGMRYENISKLTDAMEKTFDHQGYLWISDGKLMSEQKGVFRVNCIDCLDRTNVVQSAFARYILNKQLGAVALLNQAERHTENDSIFNDSMSSTVIHIPCRVLKIANQFGQTTEMLSAELSTSALKGDFTRTGKRDLTGLLNDGVNSLARMYTSTFSDWFSQAVIDFMLGNRTLSVFSEFMLRLQSTDPSDLIRLSKIRAEAVATSVSRCLSDGERLLAGWTLFAPEELNTKIGDKFEEKVVLLSADAIYVVNYDYTLEKVKKYTRIPLGDITEIKKGAYILSPLEEPSRDPEQNAGFIITWLNKDQVTRLTSYSLRNSLDSGISSCPPSPTIAKTPNNPKAATTSIQTPTKPASAYPNIAASVARNKLSVSLSRKNTSSLSNILNNVAANASSDKTFAAFKMLPIDPARIRRVSSSGNGTAEYADATDEMTGATTCKEAVDLVVDAIVSACTDRGAVSKGFIKEEDVVSLEEAQRMTTMYAKMEYGVKRLLWLGG